MVIIGAVACFIFAIIMTIILLFSLMFDSSRHH
jgi:hypothetical protein